MKTYNAKTGRFKNERGTDLGVMVSRSKTGRYAYKNSTTGRTIASGVTPEQFAKLYWFDKEVKTV